MNYLLDTHTFIWFIEGDKLHKKVRDEITKINNECFLSIASLWEITIKTNLGKLELASSFHNIDGFLSDNNIKILPIELDHLKTLLTLEHFHRDPFDRIIIAQGIAQNLTILTKDKNFKDYPVKCLW